MTVRWKPLLVLSGLFLVIAVLGVIALVYTPGGQGSAEILTQARAERDSHHQQRSQRWVVIGVVVAAAASLVAAVIQLFAK